MEATCLEVGVYHGHSTELLASVFSKALKVLSITGSGQVLAMDIDRSSLTKAAAQVGELRHRVTFLHMDSLAEAFELYRKHIKKLGLEAPGAQQRECRGASVLLQSFQKGLEVIDGQHDYKNVLGDAENALQHLPDLLLDQL